MTAIPQAATINPLGTLFWTDDFNTVTLPNCRAVSTQVRYGGAGPVLVIRGEDRRWLWSNKAVDGRYNERRKDGSIIPATERTPQQLATLLWTAMGEPGASVANLPNDDRPEVNWECADAAAMLKDLCERYGCRPGLQPADNTAGIFRLGSGTTLPDNTTVRWTQFATSGVLPFRVDACSKHTIWQNKFRMMSFLPDTDGVWKPADDVAYAPAGGWDGNVSDPEQPLSPTDPNWSETNEKLASMLWKVWAITSLADGTLDVPEYQTVPDRWHLLPLLPRLLLPDVNTFGDSGQSPFLIGTGRPLHDPDEPVDNSPPGTIFDVSFSTNRDLGFVTTSVPLVQLDGNGLLAGAEVYLVAAHLVRSVNNFQYLQHVRVQTPGGVGVRTVRRQDVQRLIRNTYGTGANHTVSQGLVDNVSSVNAALDGSISALLTAIGPHTGIIREYNGTQLIPLSGRVQSVSWMLDSNLKGGRGPGNYNVITTASQDIETGTILYSPTRRRHTQSDVDASLRLVRQQESARLIRQGGAA